MIKVVGFPHPFLASHVELSLDAGLSYREIVERVRKPDNFAHALVFLKDEAIIEDRFEEIPDDGSTIIVRMVPGSSGNDIGKGGLWAAIAGAVLLFIPGMQFFGILLIGAGVATMALGGAIAGGLFAKPRSTDTDLSISGASNTASPWGALPVILGKHLVTPFYAGSPYTELGGTDGEDQYLRLLFVLGYGPLRVSNIKIGDNMLATNAADVRDGVIDTSTGNYTSVNLEIRSNGTHATYYPAMVVEEQVGVELKHSDASTAHIYTTPKATTRIEVEIIFPAGLLHYGEDGSKGNATVAVTAYYRAVGAGSWSTLGSFSLTRAKSKTMRFNVGANVTSGEYEVRLYRTTADKADGDTQTVDQVSWLCLRSFRASYPVDDSIADQFVFLALKIKATDQLSGVVDKLNCICEGVYPAYDGSGSGSSNWVAGVTSNPAAAYLWYLRGPMNPRPVTDALIDWALLEEWYTYCASSAFTCDAVVGSDRTLLDVLKMIAVTGRASPTLRDGLYSVVVDKARTTPVQFFTPVNSRDFVGSKAFPEAIHGYRISFINRDADYSSDEIIVLDDNYLFDIDSDGSLEDAFGTHRSVGGSYVLATLFEEISLQGVVTAANAWKHGRYLLAVRRLRPEIFQLTAGIASIRCQRGDLVSVAHDVPMLGLAYGRIKTLVVDGSSNVTGITVTEACPMVVGVTYGINIWNDDGTMTERTLVNPGVEGEYTSLTFTVAIPAASAPTVDSLFSFGELGLESVDMILAGVEGMEDLEATLQFVEYNAAIYSADGGTIPTYVSKTTRAKLFLPAQTVAESGDQQTPAAEAHDAAAEAIVTAIEAIPDYTPTYLGKFLDSAPTANVTGDVYVRYSATSGTTHRGVFRWDGVAWVRTEARTYIMGAPALDIVVITSYRNTAGVALYGTTSDYTGDSTVQADYAFFMFAVISYVQTQRVEFSEVVSSLVKASSSLTAGDLQIYMGKDPRRPTDASRLFEFALKEYIGDNGLTSNAEEWMAHFLTKKQGTYLGAPLALILSGLLYSCSGVYSKPGTMWYEATQPFGATIANAIGYGNGVFVMGGDSGKIARSTDNGETWGSLVSNPFSSAAITQIKYGNSVWVAVGAGGSIARSTDGGASWGSLVSGPFGANDIRGLAYGNSVWISGGSNGSIARSTNDGTSWGSLISGPFGAQSIYGIAFGNGVFVAVGGNGSISRSTDSGVSWSSLISNPFGTTAIRSVIYGNGIFLACAETGKIARSTDGGLTWGSLISNPFGTDSVFACVHGNGTWLAVGNSGKIARSADGGYSWEEPSSGQTYQPFGSSGYFRGVAFDDAGRFVICGYLGSSAIVIYSDWLEAGTGIVMKETAYTPTLVGFGTPTNVSFSWLRVGNRCRVVFSFTPGTTTATEARLPLPWGLTVDSALVPARRPCGRALRSTAGVAQRSILMLGADAYVTFSLVNSSGVDALSPQNGNSVATSGETFAGEFEVPITGWNT